MAKKQKKSIDVNKEVTRPPVVVVMGHIDHGKSTLLDYIRKTDLVAGEAGGITQHLSAYKVTHKTAEGENKNLTFLDTPGHSAFQQMRHRGADVADVAILIVSAEDGVMPQTLQALSCIKSASIPFVVAINKIDKPGANLTTTQSSLIENEIYIEGFGGDIPWVGISAKTGEGVDTLLDLVLLTADMADLKGNPDAPATGTIIESNMDNKRGITATLIVKNGTLTTGTCVVSGKTWAPVRIMEDYMGATIRSAEISDPVRVVGFSDVPTIGSEFATVSNKKEAERLINDTSTTNISSQTPERNQLPLVPVLIKADVAGTLDAIKHELDSFCSERICVRVIDATIGTITVGDVQTVSATENSIVVGFNVKVEPAANEIAQRTGVEIKTFDIIYELSEWLETALKERTPKQKEEVLSGTAKVIKLFSIQKNTYVLGARMETGELKKDQLVKISRRDIEIGKGTLTNLQQSKQDTNSVSEGEFGLQINSKTDIAPGDIIKGFDTVIT